MEGHLSFDKAFAIWHQVHCAKSESDYEIAESDFDLAERSILECQPTSLVEAEKMLELVAANIGSGTHWDGREVRALSNVISFIRTKGLPELSMSMSA